MQLRGATSSVGLPHSERIVRRRQFDLHAWSDAAEHHNLRSVTRIASSADTPRIARTMVVCGLADWGLWPVKDDVVTCANELVINAVVHAVPVVGVADPLVSVSMRRWRGLVVVDVGDGDPRPPRAVDQPDNEATSGRGLLLVRGLSDGWTWMPRADGGKIVRCWFDLARYGLPREGSGRGGLAVGA